MECPICFEPINKGSFIKFIPCNHCIHIECINEWKESRNDNSLVYKCISCNTYRDYEFTLNPVKENLDKIEHTPVPEIQEHVRRRRSLRELIICCFRIILRI